MPSHSPQREREAERGLNVGTLAIASIASATAALIVSQLWIAGTWIAAAVTPVLVALIAELIRQPTQRIQGALAGDDGAAFPAGEDPAPRRGDAPERDPNAPRPGAEAPIRIYRAGSSQPTRRSRRKVAVGAVAATAGIAFVVAALLITVPELIAGQSIGQGDRGSTFFGGTSRDGRSARQDTVTVTTQQDTAQRTAPEEEEQPSETAPATTTPSTTATTPAPRATPLPETTTPAP